MAKIFNIFLISCMIVKIDTANILAVFPVPSISHQIVFRPLTQELARRGHNVTVITPDPAFHDEKTPTNLREIDVHNISYTIWRKEVNNIALDKNNGMLTSIKISIILNTIFGHQLRSPEIQKLIKEENMHFDLIFSEACVPSSLIFSYIYKSPVIQISSFGHMMKTYMIMGAPNHPILQPIVIRRKLYNLSLWERFFEIYKQLRYNWLDFEYDKQYSIMLKNILGPNIPTVEDLYINIDMVFLNIYPIWCDNTPDPPGIIYLGGLHLNPKKELPLVLKNILNNSKFGVVYVSFGSNIQPSVLPPHQIEMMAQTLSELPYDVIWKWDIDFPGNYSNIKVLKWVPQSDILRHKNTKLFITQGGLQSTDEAISGGVPLIGMPIMADQFYNVQKYVRHGIGKQFDIDTVTKEEFKDAVVTIINDQSYRSNIVKLRSIVEDQPQTALERAVWWTEYVLRHGGAKHLRAPAANMSWTEYYEINLVLILLTCLIAIFCCLYIIFCYMWRLIYKLKLLSVKLKKL